MVKEMGPELLLLARQGVLVKAALRKVLSEVKWPRKAAAKHIPKWTPFHSLIDMIRYKLLIETSES